MKADASSSKVPKGSIKVIVKNNEDNVIVYHHQTVGNILGTNIWDTFIYQTNADFPIPETNKVEEREGTVDNWLDFEEYVYLRVINLNTQQEIENLDPASTDDLWKLGEHKEGDHAYKGRTGDIIIKPLFPGRYFIEARTVIQTDKEETCYVPTNYNDFDDRNRLLCYKKGDLGAFKRYGFDNTYGPWRLRKIEKIADYYLGLVKKGYSITYIKTFTYNTAAATVVDLAEDETEDIAFILLPTTPELLGARAASTTIENPKMKRVRPDYDLDGEVKEQVVEGIITEFTASELAKLYTEEGAKKSVNKAIERNAAFAVTGVASVIKWYNEPGYSAPDAVTDFGCTAASVLATAGTGGTAAIAISFIGGTTCSSIIEYLKFTGKDRDIKDLFIQSVSDDIYIYIYKKDSMHSDIMMINKANNLYDLSIITEFIVSNPRSHTATRIKEYESKTIPVFSNDSQYIFKDVVFSSSLGYVTQIHTSIPIEYAKSSETITVDIPLAKIKNNLESKISGNVFDNRGKPIDGAIIKANSEGFEKIVSTDTSGIFQISNVPIKTYILTVEKAGYQIQKLNVNSIQPVNIILIPNQPSPTTVTVTPIGKITTQWTGTDPQIDNSNHQFEEYLKKLLQTVDISNYEEYLRELLQTFDITKPKYEQFLRDLQQTLQRAFSIELKK